MCWQWLDVTEYFCEQIVDELDMLPWALKFVKCMIKWCNSKSWLTATETMQLSCWYKKFGFQWLRDETLSVSVLLSHSHWGHNKPVLGLQRFGVFLSQPKQIKWYVRLEIISQKYVMVLNIKECSVRYPSEVLMENLRTRQMPYWLSDLLVNMARPRFLDFPIKNNVWG